MRKYPKIIFEKNDLLDFFKEVKKNKFFSFKVKIKKYLDKSSLILISFFLFLENKGVAFIPFKKELNCFKNEDIYLDEIFLSLKSLFENKNIKKIGWDIKYSYQVMRSFNIFLKGVFYDVKIESYLLGNLFDSDKNSVNILIKRYFKKNYFSFFLKESFVYSFFFDEYLTKEEFFQFIEDVYKQLLLHKLFLIEFKKNLSLIRFYREIEIPMIIILSKMEKRGIFIDQNNLKNQFRIIDNKIKKIKNKVYLFFNKKFNLLSSVQVQEILFKKLKLPVLLRNSLGVPIINENVLKRLSLIHELPGLILTYRILSKIKSTYIIKLLSMMNPITHKIHTSYSQTSTITGRISSKSPNLQNIPIKKKIGRKIRNAFITEKNYQIISFDYSQIELRIIAHLSRDKKLISDFFEEKDIHKMMAAKIFNVHPLEVTLEQRSDAKQINFALVYGMTSFGLSRKLNISSQKAKEYINQYIQRYSEVFSYIKYVQKKAVKDGYIQTLFGRKIHIQNFYIGKNCFCKVPKRKLFNLIVQGTAADIVKKAMISIDRWIKKFHPDLNLLIQLHDELVFEVHENTIKVAKKIISYLMENVIDLNVGLKVNIKIGSNWGNIK